MDTSELQKIKQRYNIVGNCDALNHALDVALQVAATDLSVLIVGESGVGKEIIPRLIHDNSPRKREKYFAINCGSIPEGTIDSELFGHEKGSFTGAIGESEGYFGTANKGTIFLDEVGELPIATQARLLRVLETGEYIRVREDLYYRLNTIPIQMPPLRERGEDILLLFRLFTMQMAEKYRIPRITLTEDAKMMMLKYKWPGNVRQLKNITEQMSVLSQKREIDAEALSKFMPHDQESTELTTTATPDAHSYESEREILYKILYELRGNVGDLRREMSTLRKQIDDNNTLNSFTNARGIQSLAAPEPNTQPTDISALHHYPTQQPHFSPYQDVEAEEIRENDSANGESLNLSDIGRQVVEKALERNGGNRKKAAQELGISDRTLYRRLKQYGLDKQDKE